MGDFVYRVGPIEGMIVECRDVEALEGLLKRARGSGSKPAKDRREQLQDVVLEDLEENAPEKLDEQSRDLYIIKRIEESEEGVANSELAHALKLSPKQIGKLVASLIGYVPRCTRIGKFINRAKIRGDGTVYSKTSQFSTLAEAVRAG